MVTLVTNANDLPPNMILLPAGGKMKLSEFWSEHGDDLRPFMDAKIAVVTPSLHVPSDVDRAMVAVVGLVVITIVGIVLRKKPSLAAVLGPVAAAYASDDVVDWVKHHIEHGRIVRVYTLHELFPQIGNGQTREQPITDGTRRS